MPGLENITSSMLSMRLPLAFQDPDQHDLLWKSANKLRKLHRCCSQVIGRFSRHLCAGAEAGRPGSGPVFSSPDPGGPCSWLPHFRFKARSAWSGSAPFLVPTSDDRASCYWFRSSNLRAPSLELAFVELKGRVSQLKTSAAQF